MDQRQDGMGGGDGRQQGSGMGEVERQQQRPVEGIAARDVAERQVERSPAQRRPSPAPWRLAGRNGPCGRQGRGRIQTWRESWTRRDFPRRIFPPGDNTLASSHPGKLTNHMQAGEPSQWEERGLRDAVLRGDAAAWRVLHDRCFDPLYAFVFLRCGRRRDRAEEVVEDCWMIAVRKIADFCPERGAFQGWLWGIAEGVLRNRWRREDALLHGLPANVSVRALLLAVADQADGICFVARDYGFFVTTIERAWFLPGASIPVDVPYKGGAPGGH